MQVSGEAQRGKGGGVPLRRGQQLRGEERLAWLRRCPVGVRVEARKGRRGYLSRRREKGEMKMNKRHVAERAAFVLVEKGKKEKSGIWNRNRNLQFTRTYYIRDAYLLGGWHKHVKCKLKVNSSHSNSNTIKVTKGTHANHRPTATSRLSPRVCEAMRMTVNCTSPPQITSLRSRSLSSSQILSPLNPLCPLFKPTTPHATHIHHLQTSPHIFSTTLLRLLLPRF